VSPLNYCNVQSLLQSFAAYVFRNAERRIAMKSPWRVGVDVGGTFTDLIVIDPGSPTEHVLRRPAVWAIGQQIPWEPSHRSPEVFAGLQDSVGRELAVLDLQVASGDPTARLRGPELIVHLKLVEGLDQQQLDAVLARLAKRWAADDRIATLVDSLSVKLSR